jgi:mRNA interferase RelE/StbE
MSSLYLYKLKNLTGSKDSYRIRIGDYRVIFEIHKDIILITKIGDRKDIYK